MDSIFALKMDSLFCAEVCLNINTEPTEIIVLLFCKNLHWLVKRKGRMGVCEDYIVFGKKSSEFLLIAGIIFSFETSGCVCVGLAALPGRDNLVGSNTSEIPLS